MVNQETVGDFTLSRCVSGPTRKPGNDPGRLELVRGVWLGLPGGRCGRKYPIIEDIPDVDRDR